MFWYGQIVKKPELSKSVFTMIGPSVHFNVVFFKKAGELPTTRWICAGAVAVKENIFVCCTTIRRYGNVESRVGCLITSYFCCKSLLICFYF